MEIPKATNQYKMPVQSSDKQTQLLELGITRQRASEYERMAAHPEAGPGAGTPQEGINPVNDAYVRTRVNLAALKRGAAQSGKKHGNPQTDDRQQKPID